MGTTPKALGHVLRARQFPAVLYGKSRNMWCVDRNPKPASYLITMSAGPRGLSCDEAGATGTSTPVRSTRFPGT